jgi:cytochrome P450
VSTEGLRGGGPTIPTARGVPLLGALPWMVRDPIGFLAGVVREHGPLVRIPMGRGGLVLVAHPEDVRYILRDNASNFVRGRSVDLIRPMLGNGLPLNDGAPWLKQRRIMQPVFNRARLATMAAVMTDVAARYVDGWRPGQGFLARDQMMRLTRDVIVETMFSGQLENDTRALDHALETIEAYVSRYAFLPVPKWAPRPGEKAFREAIVVLDRLVYGLIDARRKSAERPDDVLSALIDARDPETGDGMPDEALRDEVLTLFFAGHETTANALTWALALLSANPSARDRLHAEVDAVLGGARPTADSLTQLVYTRAVLSETLRLYPPAWIFARMPLEPDALRGHAVKPSDVLLLCPYATHRLPEHWPDPERFAPERFLEDPSLGLGGTKSFSYFPFGGGPHVCIGNHFAMMEASIVLGLIAQRFVVRVDDPARVRPRAAATLHVHGGLPVHLEGRAS